MANDREPEIDDGEAEAALDAEDAAVAAGMRKQGFDDAEIARLRGVSVEEIDAKAPPTLGTIEAELRQIEQRRREDRRAYFKDEAMQQRERELLAVKEKLKAGQRTSPDDADAERKDDLRAIEDELREIDRIRRTDGRAYRRDEALQARERELLEAREQAELAADGGDDLPEALQERWRESGGIKENLEAVRSRVVLALGDAVSTDDVQDLFNSFDDELSDDIRVEVADQLTAEHNWPAARPAEVEQFVATEWGAELSQTWGGRTPRMLGAARREADAILGRLTETSRLKVEAWAMARSAAQKRHVIQVLAARATRRL